MKLFKSFKYRKRKDISMYCMDLRWRMDKAAHLAYLGTLAQEGFVVASVEYRTSNEGTHPMQLCDIKAAIRYLRAYAKRYRINSEKFGVMGESAGGYQAAYETV